MQLEPLALRVQWEASAPLGRRADLERPVRRVPRVQQAQQGLLDLLVRRGRLAAWVSRERLDPLVRLAQRERLAA